MLRINKKGKRKKWKLKREIYNTFTGKQLEDEIN